MDQGDIAAQYNLGLMYEKGQGVPQDYKEAIKWLRRAADHGNARAQDNLGLMYANGRGVPQNLVDAHKWFNLAAANGNESSRKARDIVAQKMTPAQIREAQTFTRQWKPKEIKH